MTQADPFSPEAFDPFFVPDRTSESVSFIGAAILAAPIPVAPFFVPLTTENIGLMFGVALFAALVFYRGLRARRHRLSRMQHVANLHARLVRQGEDSVSG